MNKTILKLITIILFTFTISYSQYKGKMVSNTLLENHPKWGECYELVLKTSVPAYSNPEFEHLYQYSYDIVNYLYTTRDVSRYIYHWRTTFETGYLADGYLDRVKLEGYIIGRKHPTEIKVATLIFGGATIGWLCGRELYFEAMGTIVITAVLADLWYLFF